MSFYLYDITERDATDLEIIEKENTDNCLIRDKENVYYSGFLLYKKMVQIICIIKFYKSSQSKKYIPRLFFKKQDKDGNEKHINQEKAINIDFNNSIKAIPFWNMIGFIYKFKDLVDTGEFENTYNISRLDNHLTDKTVLEYLSNNPDLIKQAVQYNITESDVISIGYRKNQLVRYKNMLKNDNLTEADWQYFFEKNNWIFGYGLSYIFHNNLDEKKMEQVVSGYDLNNSGKRVDAILKTSGFISSLCFVEIKTHKTELLQKQPYRVGCWSVSNELMGGITQIQNTVSLALKNFYGKTQTKDKTTGDLTGEEFFNFQPKSFLIIGSLSQLTGNNFPNEDKFRSFELFRKNISSPEIITFDELYERAKFIVESQ